MKDNLKLGLLGFVALMTVVNTALIVTNDDGPQIDRDRSARRTASNAAINPAETPVGASTELNLNDFKGQNPAQAAPQQPSQPPTAIAFAEMSHNFGKIKQDTKNKKVFTFTNTGDNPLIIQNAQGSCGCTVPKYPKEPIPPGGTGEIEVEYSPGKRKGNQTKTVTITANTEPSVTTLQISAMVEEVPAS